MGRWREAVVVYFEFLHNGSYSEDFSGAAGCDWQDLGALSAPAVYYGVPTAAPSLFKQHRGAEAL